MSGAGAGTPERKLSHSNMKRAFSISALPKDKFTKWYPCPHIQIPPHPLPLPEGLWDQGAPTEDTEGATPAGLLY